MAEFSLKAAADVATRQDMGTVVVLKDEQGDPFTFVDANGATQECEALVAGQLSTRYRKAEDAMRDRQLKRRSISLTGEMIAKQQIDLVAACVVSWNLHGDGKPIPCTKENVVQVLTAAPWLRTDIEAAMSDAARFLG